MKKSKQPYHHGDLRDKLLDAAERALEKSGVQELSLRELSRDLGVSNTAPRHHFADKQALLNALAMSGYERLEVILAKSIANRDLSFRERLLKLSRAYVVFAGKHPRLLELMFNAKHASDAPMELVEAGTRAFSAGEILVQEGQAIGDVIEGNPVRLGWISFAIVQGLIAISSNGNIKGVKLDEVVTEAVDRLIQGIGK